ncbi:MAG: CvpA family protein [Chitinophagaceae bacterium]|jgi:membrane protein required for colicin V production|nr:CvpA family protein [Sediminibacterium sp.]
MWIDILSGTILIIAILQGYRHGLIKAIISFFSLFIGLVVAFQFAGYISNLLKEHTKIGSQWLPFIAFLVVLIGVMILLKMITGILQQSAEWLMLGWLNKLLGMILYALIYGTILSAVLYFMILLGVVEKASIKDSFSFSYLESWWPYFMKKLSLWIPSIKSSLSSLV